MENEKKIKVVLLEPGKLARAVEINASLAEMQKVVGGLIEPFYPFEEQVCIVCNEESKIKGMRPNRSVKNDDGVMVDLKQFATEAKRYGVVYCALRGKERSGDGMVDIMVRAEDASKINRIVERFKLATVDTVSIKRDIEQAQADKAAPSTPEQEKPDKAADDRLLDDLLGAPIQKEEHASPNPAAAKTEKSRPSAPTSEKQSRTAEGTAKSPEERPSVREELREIRESRQKEAAEPGISEPTPAKEPKKQPTTTHKQPSRKKPKKAKER